MSNTNSLSSDLISIIVPIYNVSHYLDACVDSIIHQTYSNLEILLIDDGSIDGSEKQCDEWAKKDSRILVVHQTNHGIASARNTGIDHCTGAYIMFIDSDDCIHPQMCELLWKSLTDSKSSIACCNSLWIQDDEVPPTPHYDTYTTQITHTESALILLNYPSPSPMVYVWNKLYTRSIIGDTHFPEGMKTEDLYFNISIFSKCTKFIYIKDKLYFYRQRQGSIMHQQKEDISLCKNYIKTINRQLDAFVKLGNKEALVANISRQLNSMARYETRYCILHYKESQRLSREAFLQIYKKYSQYLKFLPDRKKILVARFCLPLYHLMKRAEIKKILFN